MFQVVLNLTNLLIIIAVSSVANANPAVFHLNSNQGEVATCFCIGKGENNDLVFLSCGHYLGDSVAVVDHNNTKYQAKILVKSRYPDYSIISVKADLNKTDYLEINKTPEFNEPVEAIVVRETTSCNGNSCNRSRIIQRFKCRMLSNSRVNWYNQPGDSGAPICQNNKVIGIQWGHEGGQTYYTPIDQVKEIAEPSNPTNPTSPTNPTNNDLDKLLSKLEANELAIKNIESRLSQPTEDNYIKYANDMEQLKNKLNQELKDVRGMLPNLSTEIANLKQKIVTLESRDVTLANRLSLSEDRRVILKDSAGKTLADQVYGPGKPIIINFGKGN